MYPPTILSLLLTTITTALALPAPDHVVELDKRLPVPVWTKGPITQALEYAGYLSNDMGIAGTAAAGKTVVLSVQTDPLTVSNWKLQWGNTYVHWVNDPSLCLASGATCDGTRDPKAGQSAFLAACDPSMMGWKSMGVPATTQWYANEGQLQLRNTNLCLDLKDYKMVSRQPVVLVPCNGNATQNIWNTFPYILTD